MYTKMKPLTVYKCNFTSDTFTKDSYYMTDSRGFICDEEGFYHIMDVEDGFEEKTDDNCVVSNDDNDFECVITFEKCQNGIIIHSKGKDNIKGENFSNKYITKEVEGDIIGQIIYNELWKLAPSNEEEVRICFQIGKKKKIN